MHGLHPLAAAAWRLAPWTRAGALALMVVVVSASFPPALHAQGPVAAGAGDGVTLVFEGRASRAPEPLIWTGPLFRLPVPSLSQANLRIDATRFVPNLGSVRGAVDLGAGGHGIPSRGVIELAAASMGSWMVGISAGDTALTAYSLDYRLSSLFTPYVGLRGVQVTAARGRTEVSVFGGQTSTSSGWFGERVVVSPQALVGVRYVIRPADRLALATSLVGTSTPSPSTIGVPLSSTAVTSDAIYRVWRGVDVIGQATVTDVRWFDGAR